VTVDTRKMRRLEITMPKAAYDAMTRQARKSGLSLASWARATLYQAAQLELTPVRKKEPPS
jgi:hypothetical protein